MESIPVSQFKARCLALLAQVKRTGEPILVTRFGKPVAEVVPPTPTARQRKWLGSLSGSVEIGGDIVSPAIAPGEWEAVQE